MSVIFSLAEELLVNSETRYSDHFYAKRYSIGGGDGSKKWSLLAGELGKVFIIKSSLNIFLFRSGEIGLTVQEECSGILVTGPNETKFQAQSY